MNNMIGFIPNRYRQPDRYDCLFGRWNAIYRHPNTGREIIIEAVPKTWNDAYGEVGGFNILVRRESCRIQLVTEMKSVKKCIDHVESWLVAAV